MSVNPVLAMTGPFAPGKDMTLTLFDGSTVAVPGVTKDAPATPGEVGAAWADSGRQVWIGFDGDPDQIEYITVGMERFRAVFRERIASPMGWNTVRVVLQDFAS